MNAVINTKNRPYIVMEGLVDVNLPSASTSIPKSNPKTMLYAGGLHERYGLKMLVDAFVNLNRNDWQLVIYGNGPYEKELRTIAENNQNVIYRGVAPNEEVVEAEYRASLLVNPRPTTEEFTKYSFPSKNMEYMVSGTPLLTTRLPGMPKEYWDYVYLFDEETTEGYQCKFEEIFSLSDAELSAKGALAQEFVINRKNNTIQADRILQMLNTL
jgi:glycosyltransferase involved in cell wall biosynthesis